MSTSPFKRSKFADRGKKAEAAVQKYLDWWEKQNPQREYNRLPDTKAAGRIIKAAKADFEFFSAAEGERIHGLIEVKETEHEYRLAKDKVPQLPALRKRSKCGGICVVLIYHSTLNQWRVATSADLMAESDKGSWNLQGFRTFPSPGHALQALDPYFFERGAE